MPGTLYLARVVLKNIKGIDILKYARVLISIQPLGGKLPDVTEQEMNQIKDLGKKR